jgi:hypothetical protein
MRRALHVFALALAVLAVAGCKQRTGDLTIVTNRTVNLDAVDLDSLPTAQRIEGNDEVLMILGIPTGIPDLEAAVDDALDNGQGDVMTDVVMYRTHWSAILFGKVGIRVVGDVIQTRRTGK